MEQTTPTIDEQRAEKKRLAKVRADMRKARKEQFVGGMEDAPIRDALAVSVEGTKKAIARMVEEEKREKLDLWVEQIFGRKAHPNQPAEVLAKYLTEYIDGKIDEQGKTTRKGRAASRNDAETTHTEKEDTEMAQAAKKIETNGKKGKKAKAKITGAKKVTVKKDKKGKVRILGKTTNLNRVRYFFKIILENEKKKYSDTKLLEMAKKEFPQKEAIIGEKCWTIGTCRSWVNGAILKGKIDGHKKKIEKYGD